MAIILPPQPWTRQPQIPVGINRGNPLARGIIAYTTPVVPNGTVVGSVTRSIGTNGQNWVMPGGAACIDVTSTGYTAGSPMSGIVLIRSIIGQGFGSAININYNGTNIPFALSLSLRGNTTGIAASYYASGWKVSSASGVNIDADGKWHMLGGAVVSGSQRCFLDGALSNSATNTGTDAGVNLNPISFGTYKNDSDGLVGDMALGVVWNRFLSDSEFAQLYANPWQLFAPLPRRIFVGPSAGGASTNTKTATLDAAIQQAKTATATLDAAIQVANTKTATLDGVIATRNTATVTLDAAIRQAVTATVTLDGAIRATISTSSTLDAVIQTAGVNTYTLTATLDAAIREAKSLTATLDAAIQIANTKTVTLDGVIVSVNTKTATLDATIRATATMFALLDAYIFDADAPIVVPDTRQTPAGKSRNTRRRYIMPDDTIVMATPDEAEQLVKLFVKPKVPKKAPKVVKELRVVDLVEFEPQSSDTVETERIVVKPRKAVWETTTDVYEKAMKLLADREIKRRRQEEELILLYA